MVSIIDWHFSKTGRLGFDLDHQIELGGGRSTLCVAVIGARPALHDAVSSDCGAGGQDRYVGVLDLIRHGLLERGNTAIDLGDGQSRLEAQHDLDKDDAA
jgi:hypothetical protein